MQGQVLVNDLVTGAQLLMQPIDAEFAVSKFPSRYTIVPPIAPAGNTTLHSVGGVGDGVADDTAALVAAYAATPDGGTLVIPAGGFRFTGNIQWNRSVSVVGLGTISALIPDLNSTTVDAIVVQGPSNNPISRIRLDNFAILSAKPNACRDAFVCQRINLSEVNIHVAASAARYGSRLSGNLGTKFRIVSSTNYSYPYPISMPTQDAVRIPFEVISGTGFNANILQLFIEGALANSLWIEDQGGQGNSKITGIIEGGQGGGTRGIYIKGCNSLSISNLHCETNANATELDTCNSCSIGDGSVFSTNGSGQLTLTHCSGIDLGAVECGTLSIGTTCSNITLSPSALLGISGGSGLVDPSGIAITAAGTIKGVTASIASATPVTLLDMGLRGGRAHYSVYASLPAGPTFQAIADFVYDGGASYRVAGTNGAAMTLTLSANAIQATQTSGGPASIAYSIGVTPG